MLEFEEDIVCCGIGHGVTVLCVREIWDDGASGDIVCWECGIVETSGEDIVVAEEDIVLIWWLWLEHAGIGEEDIVSAENIVEKECGIVGDGEDIVRIVSDAGVEIECGIGAELGDIVFDMGEAERIWENVGIVPAETEDRCKLGEIEDIIELVWKRASDGNIVGKSGAELGDDDNSVSERSGGGRLDMVDVGIERG
jgi:hypothetical protein